MMLTFDIDNGKFVYRTAGIIVNNDKILFQKDLKYDFWFLPGGRVEFFETSASALNREIIEEYNVRLISSRLIWIVENFFRLNQKQYHEIGLYYKLVIEEDSKILKYKDEFEGEETGYLHRWIGLQEIEEFNIVPKFLKHELKQINDTRVIKHIINKDE